MIRPSGPVCADEGTYTDHDVYVIAQEARVHEDTSYLRLRVPFADDVDVVWPLDPYSIAVGA